MRFYNRQHRHYCGIDLHVKTMYVCILDATGQVLVHRNVKSTAEAFLETVAPYRDDLVVAAECMFTWYWLADLCAAEQIAFVLGPRPGDEGHPRGKAKNDKIDSQKIAACSAAGFCRRRTSTRPRCARHATSSAGVSTWCESAGSCWPFFSISASEIPSSTIVWRRSCRNRRASSLEWTSGPVTISTSGVPPRLKSTASARRRRSGPSAADVSHLRRVLLEVRAHDPDLVVAVRRRH